MMDPKEGHSFLVGTTVSLEVYDFPTYDSSSPADAVIGAVESSFESGTFTETMKRYAENANIEELIQVQASSAAVTSEVAIVTNVDPTYKPSDMPSSHPTSSSSTLFPSSPPVCLTTSAPSSVSSYIVPASYVVTQLLGPPSGLTTGSFADGTLSTSSGIVRVLK
jgi:hypothetical protein